MPGISPQRRSRQYNRTSVVMVGHSDTDTAGAGSKGRASSMDDTATRTTGGPADIATASKLSIANKISAAGGTASRHSQLKRRGGHTTPGTTTRNDNTRDSTASGYDGTTSFSSSSSPSCCRGLCEWINGKVSLVVVLFAQCFLVTAAFVTLIVVTDRLNLELTNDLVRDATRTELKYGASQVNGSITTTIQTLEQVRDKMAAYESVHGVGPCNVNTDGFQASANFYADTAYVITANPIIAGMYFTAITNDVSNASSLEGAALTGATMSQCLAARKSISRTHLGAVNTTYRLPTHGDWPALDQLPLNPSAVTTHHKEFATISLTQTVSSFETFAAVVGGRFTCYVVMSAPYAYNITDKATGALVLPPNYPFYQRADLAPFLAAPQLYTIRTVSSVAIAIGVDALPAILDSITLDVALAQTALYDLNLGVLLAASGRSSQEALNLDTMTMRTAGRTGYYRLDLAYNAADPMSLVGNGDTRVSFDDKKFLIAVMLYSNEYDVRWAFVQATPKDYYYSGLYRLRAILIAVGVACAVVVTLACVAFGATIRMGVSVVITNMALAANLRNDRVVETHSYLSEVEALMKGFVAMNDKITIAKAYLPQHLLVSSSEEESGVEGDEGDCNVSRGATTVSMSTVSHAASNQSGNNNNRRSTQASGGGKGKFVRDDGIAAGANGISSGAGQALALKRVTLLAINARNFSGGFNISAPSTIPTPANSLCELVCDIASLNRGMIDSFHGDHFIVSFNAIRANVEGPLKAARTAVEIITSSNSNNQLFTMGIATGRCAVGQLGTAALKRLSIIGPAYGRAVALERLCRKFTPTATTSQHYEDESALAIQCLVAAATAQDIQHACTLQVLGAVYGAPFSSTGGAELTSEKNRWEEYGRNAGAGAGGGGGVSDSGMCLGKLDNPTSSSSDTSPCILTNTTINNAGGPTTTSSSSSPSQLFGMEVAFAKPSQRRPLSDDIEIVRAIRGATFDRSNGGAANDDNGDEWLYELSACRNTTAKSVEALNASMVAFITATADAATKRTSANYSPTTAVPPASTNSTTPKVASRSSPTSPAPTTTSPFSPIAVARKGLIEAVAALREQVRDQDRQQQEEGSDVSPATAVLGEMADYAAAVAEDGATDFYKSLECAIRPSGWLINV